MVKLYFLEWENGLVKAGFTYNGKRYISLVSTQNGTAYVRTGSAVNHDLTLHQLSNSQRSAVYNFILSKDYAVEYADPIQ